MESQFNIEGYQEEIWDAVTRKCLGTRQVAQDDSRVVGCNGDKDFVITENLTIKSGHKSVVLKASAAKPRKLFSRYYPICGRMTFSVQPK